MEHYSIHLHNPSAKYLPNSFITGDLIIKNQEPLGIQSINILFLGESNVCFSVYSARAVHFEKMEQLWIGERIILPGTHHFQISSQLPSQCPPSFEGKHGSIRYKIQVEILKADNKPKVQLDRDFYVLPSPSAISQIVPVQKTKSIFYRRFIEEEKELKIQASAPKTGYVAGEIIPITIWIKNFTDLSIKSISLRLVRCTVYLVPPREETEQETVLEFRKYTEIRSGVHTSKLVVPKKIIQSFVSEIIQVNYMVLMEFDLNTQKEEERKMEIELPVMIGSSVGAPRGPPSYTEVVIEEPPPRYQD
ncbi:unnamed protein product [Caenorhabditis brenneri]